MQAFTTHVGVAAPLKRSNVDTDQIIPAEYLKRVTRAGFADGLFSRLRAESDFELNQPAWREATILVPGPDFGTGSSREHAVWALMDAGFRVVIGSTFGDIFRNNSAKAGLLVAVITPTEVDALWGLLAEQPGTEVSVDLRTRTITAPGFEVTFEIDDYTRWRLLEGLDDISLTLRHENDITAFEAERPAFAPVTTMRSAHGPR